MVKILFCLRKLPSLTPAAFQKYWYEVDAPLVKKHQKVLQIAHYVQCHSDLGPMSDKLKGFRDSPEPFDGVAEIWYESRGALETLGKDPGAREASQELKQDEMRFIDTAKSPIWTGVERLII